MLYNVGKQAAFISATTSSIDTSVISADDVIHTGALVFQNCATKVNGSGRVTGFSIIEKANTGNPLKQIMKLYLFSKALTAMNSNDAFVIPNYDAAKEIVAVISVTWDVTYGSYAVADNNGKFHPIDFVCNGGQDLYGYLVAGGGATYAADASLTVKLHIQQDDSCGC